MLKRKVEQILDDILTQERSILEEVVKDKNVLSSFTKNRITEEEINFLLINNEKENLHYQIHAQIIKSLMETLLKRERCSNMSQFIKFHTQVKTEILPFVPTLQVESLENVEIIDLMEKLHYDFLNSEYVVKEGTLEKRRSKINLREKGAVYTPPRIAKTIIQKAITSWLTANKKDHLTVLDFGCGSGVFYFQALDFLKNDLSKENDEIFRSLYAIDSDPIAISILTARACNIARDHSKRFVSELSTRVICKNMLHVNDGIFADVDLDGINYTEQFSDVFRDGGFDIIVSNPPYFVLKGTGSKGEFLTFYNYLKRKIEEEVRYFRNHSFYHASIERMLNYYRLSIECMLRIASRKGVIGIICPATLFGDISAENLREKIFNENRVEFIEYFPERYKLFDNVTQASTILIVRKDDKTEKILIKNNIDDRKFFLPYRSIRHLLPHLEVPFISKEEWVVLEKISDHKKICQLPSLRNKRGELDVTLLKRFITSEDTGYPLIRGINIQEDGIVEGGKEFVVVKDFLKEKSEDYVNNDFRRVRIAGQQIVNIDAEKRLKFALTSRNHILGNSCNYITVNEPLSVDWILTQLNSHLLNWRFKMTSTNNHVNNYEIDELPIVEEAPKDLEKFKDPLGKNVLVCKEFGLDLNETILILRRHFKEIEINRKFKEISR